MSLFFTSRRKKNHVSETLYFLVFRIPYYGKPKNPVILSTVYHPQNPLETHHHHRRRRRRRRRSSSSSSSSRRRRFENPVWTLAFQCFRFSGK
jgi:hypothetical protein